MAIRRLDSLGYQLGLINRLYDKRLQDVLAPFGVAPGQFPALVMLFQKDGLTQAELCRRIGVEQPTMANTLARMERDGLIRRDVRILHRRNAALDLMTEEEPESTDTNVSELAGVTVLAQGKASKDGKGN